MAHANAGVPKSEKHKAKIRVGMIRHHELKRVNRRVCPTCGGVGTVKATSTQSAANGHGSNSIGDGDVERE